MNRFFINAFMAILIVFSLVSCGDNTCDVKGCTRKVKNVNAETQKVLNDLGIEGDYCKFHHDQKLKASLFGLAGLSSDVCIHAGCYEKAQILDENTKEILAEAGIRGQYCEKHLQQKIENTLK